MKKRLITLGLVLLLVVGVITPAAFAAPDELTVWVNNEDVERDWMKKMASKYEEETGVKIKITPVNLLDQLEKLSLDGPAGKGGDIVCWPHDKLGKADLMGVLEPISDYLPGNYAQDNYVDTAVDALTYQGKLYGLPYAYQSVALVYNKDMYPEPPETWDELISKAKDLTKGNQYGFVYDIRNFYYTYAFFGGYGAYVFGRNEDNSYNINDIGLANEGAVKAAKFVKNLRDEGLVPKGMTEDNMVGLFSEGKAGAVIDGPWSIKSYKSSMDNDKIGVAPLPKLDNGKRPETFIGVKGYYLSKFSENKQAAVDFMKFLTNGENSLDHYKESNIIVPHNEVMNSEELENDPYLTGFAEQAKYGTPMPSVPEMSQVWDPMENAITFILQGKGKPKQIMPMVVTNIEDGIRQMRQ